MACIFHKVQTYVSLRTFFRINSAPVRNCPKGARNAKLDDIRSIGHLFAIFRETSLYLVALNLDPKSASNL